MLPLSTDAATWLAEALGVVLLVEQPDARVTSLSDGTDDGDDLVRAVAARARLAPGDEGLRRAVDDARNGGVATRVRGGDGRAAIVEPHGAGLARAWITPPRPVAESRLAGVLHEVRSSLTAMNGWVELAASDRDPAHARRALAAIGSSARYALSVAGRCQHGGDHNDVHAAAIIREVAEAMRPRLMARGLELELDLADDLDCAMAPVDLRLVVDNLLRNAVEALGAGGRTKIAWSRAGEHATLVVEDDGPGMSQRVRDTAFTPHFTTKRSGTGIGLALVRDTVEAAGGNIRVESSPGAGARFTVRVPATTTRAPASVGRSPRARSGVQPRIPVEGRRVLVVDDDPGLRAMVETALTLLGADVAAAEGCRAARAARGDGRPFDLALIDVGLADGSGRDLVRELRAAGDVRGTVLMTGSVDPLPLDALPDALLRKPFELDQLYVVVREVLSAPAREVGRA